MLKLIRTTGVDMEYRFTSRVFKRLLAASVICVLFADSVALAVGPPPLNRIPVPEPPNLAQFVKDKAAAIRLGKALFWDMQAGSDGVQACASCHYRAGADNRLKNQLNPGSNATPADVRFGNNSTVIRTFDPADLTKQPIMLRALDYQPRFGPVYSLLAGDFPLFRVLPATARLEIDPLTGLTSDGVSSLRDTNDVVGSQGIRLTDFLAINAGLPDPSVESGTPVADTVFKDVNGNNLRRVTPRNAPSVINAVFNYTNNWDGRANNIFNGETAYGPLDQNAGIYIDDGVNARLVKQKVAIPNASLASQAVGQALGDEMSYRGRTFPELGRKMLTLTPLGKQLVHPSDSVLGPLTNANPQNPGLNTSYTQMIRDAFVDNLWNSGKTVTLPAGPSEPNPNFTQIEANFALFFGLAIQLYEATLVSDRTPFDRFQAGNLNALSPAAQNGFNDFISKCAACHSGSELTSAATGSTVFASNPVAFTNNTTHNLIKANINPNTLTTRLVDAGFHNTGVRPTVDDIGRGGKAPSGLDLAFTRLAGTAGLPFATPLLPPITAAQPDAVNGSFKVPGLRNVELTAPYFHNGDSLTLGQVVEFYARGGNFPSNPELAGAIQPINNMRKDPLRQLDLAAFLTTLTDDRVRNETAPFDHPQLMIPNGNLGALDDPAAVITIPPTGGAPAAVAPALTLNPVVSPTILPSQVISGTVDADATVTVTVSVNNVQTQQLFATVSGTIWSATVTGMAVGPPNIVTVTATSPTGGISLPRTDTILVRPAATITGAPTGITSLTFATLTIGGTGVTRYQYKLDDGAFSADIPVATPLALNGLSDGLHTITVLGKDGLGNLQPLADATIAAWTVNATPPLLTVEPVATPTILGRQTIGGTVEFGSVPSVTVDTGVAIGPVSIVGTGWSCQLSGLKKGTNNITVTAVDNAFNTTVRTTAIELVTPDGNFKGSGTTDLSDALRALRIAAGIIAPTAADLFHGDVAPLVNGIPAPDSAIDVADALVLLRKAIGLVSF